MSEEKFYIIIWSIVGFVTMALFAMYHIDNVMVTRHAMENGYTQELLPGANQVHWVKKPLQPEVQ